MTEGILEHTGQRQPVVASSEGALVEAWVEGGGCLGSSRVG